MTNEERSTLAIKSWMITNIFNVSYKGHRAWFEKVLEIDPTYFDGKEVIFID